MIVVIVFDGEIFSHYLYREYLCSGYKKKKKKKKRKRSR